ncbi:glycosyltransferase family 9 protein [Thermodesulfobacteriota bacterium]
MDCQTLQDAWRRQADQGVSLSETCPAIALADSFMTGADGDVVADLCCIDSLCELALDERFAAAALQALYGRIVEPLCDDFSVDGVQLCNQVLQRVIDFVRQTAPGGTMDSRLLALGFPDPVTLAHRYDRVLQSVSLAGRDHRRIRRVLVLSRVTVGADIAITSIIVHRLLAALPTAEVVVVGPAHLPHCFAGLERVRCLALPYERDGSLIQRLVVWESLAKLLGREGEGFAAGEMLLVDPDSRLSQLGLLPLLAEEDTCFFPSRLPPKDQDNPGLSQLVNRWLDNLLGEKYWQPPVVSLPATEQRQAEVFVANLRGSGCRHLVVINCGVGGDDGKRLGEPFETQLPLALLARLQDTIVILDSGCACDEKERVRSQLAGYHAMGIETDFVEEDALAHQKVGFSHGAVGFHGSIGAIGALIAGADLFFGYDSCCQHLAGALETPSVIIFAGAPNQRFAARWHPYDATGRSVVIPVADKARLDASALAALVEQVVAAMIMIMTKEKEH